MLVDTILLEVGRLATHPRMEGHDIKRSKSSNVAAEESELLTFAIPKKGRLHEQCVEMLKGCGLRYSKNPRLDIAFVNTTTMKLKLVFLPAQDIASFVADGNVDLGLTGQDMICESNSKVTELIQTGFGVCRLSLLAPKASKITHPKELCGKRLATSFPYLTEEYFNKLSTEHNLPKVSIRTISGSVEAACALGLADAVVDLVETGATMEEAGLERIDTVLHTQAVLISNPHSQHQDQIEVIRKRVEGYLLAKQFSMMYFNIHRDNLVAAQRITPGRKAPTISPLEDPNWVSVGAMVPSKEVAEIMDALHDLGATDIFLLSLENCRN